MSLMLSRPPEPSTYRHNVEGTGTENAGTALHRKTNAKTMTQDFFMISPRGLAAKLENRCCCIAARASL
jgi:hypothetical protein